MNYFQSLGFHYIALFTVSNKLAVTLAENHVLTCVYLQIIKEFLLVCMCCHRN